MRIVQPQIFGLLKGPVPLPPETTNKLEAVKVILYLLKEAGVTPGPFAVKDLFDPDLETIQNTQSELFKKLRVLVGESQTQIMTESKPAASLSRPPKSGSRTGSSQQSRYASAASSAYSESTDGIERMQLATGVEKVAAVETQDVSNVILGTPTHSTPEHIAKAGEAEMIDGVPDNTRANPDR
ncbi:hypothetical protein PInf_002577 [Phytophthora infestans]|nr:hypothetical protein PInf_002577 [Phytophthora infestans]